MSAHASGPHDHAANADRPRVARRDLLGLAALIGADSGLVPISDLDAGEGLPDEPAHATLPHVCGGCTTRCATVELARVRAENCSTETTP